MPNKNIDQVSNVANSAVFAKLKSNCPEV